MTFFLNRYGDYWVMGVQKGASVEIRLKYDKKEGGELESFNGNLDA